MTTGKPTKQPFNWPAVLERVRLPRPGEVISFVTGSLILLIAIGSFALSYSNLHQTALSYGVDPGLAPIWPLLIDFALIVFSLAVVRASLYAERTWWPWFLVALYTVGTVSFNILHAPDNLTARVVAVVAPLTLFLSFETLMAMLKNGVKRTGAALSIAQIEAESRKRRAELAELETRRLSEIEEKATLKQAEVEALVVTGQNELAKLESELGQLQGEVEVKAKTLASYQQDIEAKREELKILESGQSKIYLPANLSVTQRQELVNRLANDGMTNEAIAGALGVSVGTVKNDKKAAKIIDPVDIPGAAGHRNGNGHRKVG